MDETESRQTVEENGITLFLPMDKRRTDLLKFYNPKLKLIREIVLASLNNEVENSNLSVICLDADAGSGIGALQWKKQLGEDIQVVVADKRPQVNHFEDMCNKNKLKCLPLPLDADRVTGEWSKLNQGKDTIHMSPFSANILLYQEGFNFVYLQPNNSITPYVDAVFTNIRSNGVACFVSPNIASQCFRCPKLIHRLYQAHVLKTEYVKEMAARIVIGDIVRSAARHGRALQVLYTLCYEEHVLVAVRVLKKTKVAIECTEQIRHVLHCLMCEERVVYPDTHTPVELPYALLPCDCNDKHPGKTAVIVGPMWAGEIFSIPYLRKLVNKAKTLYPKGKISVVLESLLKEAICDSQDSVVSGTSGTDGGKQTDSTIDSVQVYREHIEEPLDKRRKTDQSDIVLDLSVAKKKNDIGNKSEVVRNEEEEKFANEDELNKPHQEQTEQLHEFKPTPMFYHNLHRQKFKGLPRSDKLVKFLQQEGYRASRTHFEDHAIRTNANGKQLEQVIHKFLQ